MADAGEQTEPSGTVGSLRTILGWAVFLGVSWTWWIGMLLPVLLFRDFGPWSFAVFAVPNVLGAAAMGFVLRDAEASRRLVARHRTACRVFSAVTIAFNFTFGVWLLGAAGLSAWRPWLIAGALGVFILAMFNLRAPLLSALYTWLVSLGCAAWLGARGDLHWLGTLNVPPRLDPTQLLALAPVCVLGFLLCPYLDLTFHRARQKLTARQCRWAFSLGFGGVFASMIAFTGLYAWAFLEGPRLLSGAWLASAASVPLALHLVVQTVFTVLVHDTDPTAREGTAGAGRVDLWRVLPLALVILFLAAIWLGPAVGPFESAEVVYRSLMGFYGLAAPAYVLICMVPYRRLSPQAERASSTKGDEHMRRKLAGFALAVCLAAPFYAAGFLGDQTWLLLAGVGLVLAARLVVHALLRTHHSR
jgi:hypothetical protein